MGYSHGGYGAFLHRPEDSRPFRRHSLQRRAPRPTAPSRRRACATRRFTFMIGEKDTAYGRRERCEEFSDEIDKLKQGQPGDYPVEMEFKKGFGHGGLPDRDKIKELYPYSRKTTPERLTWELTDSVITDFFLDLNRQAGQGSQHRRHPARQQGGHQV